jgi:type I restriction enzyme R subunit
VDAHVPTARVQGVEQVVGLAVHDGARHLEDNGPVLCHPEVAYLRREHQDHVAIRKLRLNRALTTSDLHELERILAESGIGDPDQINQAKAESQGLGLFVRSLVGLDRSAAKDALAVFLNGRSMTANQIEFVNLIVDHLTEHGVMPASLLYESPFTDLYPRGPDGLFTSAEVEDLLEVLDRVRGTAVAA